jgi:hypothetical protein
MPCLIFEGEELEPETQFSVRHLPHNSTRSPRPLCTALARLDPRVVTVTGRSKDPNKSSRSIMVAVILPGHFHSKSLRMMG